MIRLTRNNKKVWLLITPEYSGAGFDLDELLKQAKLTREELKQEGDQNV